jgi:hypothetical protein
VHRWIVGRLTVDVALAGQDDCAKSAIDAATGDAVAGNRYILRTGSFGRKRRQEQRMHRLAGKRVSFHEPIRGLQEDAARAIVQELIVAHDIAGAGVVQIGEEAALVGLRDRVVQRQSATRRAGRDIGDLRRASPQ